MRVFHSPYELNPEASGQKRRPGTLLKIEFPDVGTGFADCHPWPELGDLPWHEQLHCLQAGDPSALVRRSLALAREDALARAKDVSLFQGLKIPPSHLSFLDLLSLDACSIQDAAQNGFHQIKVKAGNAIQAETERLLELAPHIRKQKLWLRIDLNEKLTFSEADFLLKTLSAAGDLDWIDFLEDPCPFQIEEWSELRRRYHVRLALDRHCGNVAEGENRPLLGYAVDALVLKPAVAEPTPVLKLARAFELSLMVTSYLDHPIGQLGAAWVAASAMRSTRDRRWESCGLLTHASYPLNAFSKTLATEGPCLIPAQGTGIGFDSELAALDWMELR